jgi:hypothetical protein
MTESTAVDEQLGNFPQASIRAQIPLEVMSDVIQPFPTSLEIFLHGLTELGAKVPTAA